MRTCQSCGIRLATLHLTQVVGGDRTELHLCDICAGEQGELTFTDFPGGGFNIHSILAGLLNAEPQPKGTRGLHEHKCPVCGSDYRRFAEGGRLGCGECYKVFAGQLTPLLKRIHGNCSHHGKVPSRGAREILLRRQSAELRRELKTAVDNEQYELAAELRDKLKNLDQQS